MLKIKVEAKLFILLSFLGIASLFADLPSWASKSGHVALGLNTVVLVGLVSVERWPERVTGFVKLLLRPLPSSLSSKVLNTVSLFAEGLASLRKVSHLLVIVVFSILIWVVFAVMNQLVLDAFGLNLPLSAPFLVLALPNSTALKFEARNTKFETNPNDQNTKYETI